jgi:hypothetical protein
MLVGLQLEKLAKGEIHEGRVDRAVEERQPLFGGSLLRLDDCLLRRHDVRIDQNSASTQMDMQQQEQQLFKV